MRKLTQQNLHIFYQNKVSRAAGWEGAGKGNPTFDMIRASVDIVLAFVSKTCGLFTPGGEVKGLKSGVVVTS
jgi:hypothetical protein